MRKYIYLSFLAVLFYSDFVKSRPVSYPGGLTLMLMNNSMKNSLHAHYSPTAKASFGYKFEYWRKNQFSLNLIQMNNLIKRWNKPDSQANFYLKSGLGMPIVIKGDLIVKMVLLVSLGFQQIGKIKGILFNMLIGILMLLK